MDVLWRVLLALFPLGFYQTQAADFQEDFWREAFTLDVVTPGASLSTTAHTKNECILHCLQLEDCKTSAFHQHSATCWLYRHLVEYTTTGMASPGTHYFWRLSPSCPGELGYQLEAGICFMVYATMVNWTTAEETCKSDGGYLLIADTAEKRSAVIQQTNATVWLGASDEDKEGEWRWNDRSLMQTNNWSPGEPNNKFGSEHFLQLNLNGLFNDMPAFASHAPACQVPLLQ